jgi:pimeloyl-ACP methyl ester carboxylesterase
VRRVAAVLLLLCVAVSCASRGGPKPVKGGETACVRLAGERQIRGEVMCEDAWSCYRPPFGPLDRIGLRRIGPCEPSTGPVVLYLPGMYMNAEVGGTDANTDIRLYLAQAGIPTWGLDWRTHAVAPEATPQDLAVLGSWDADTFTEDAAWAAGFVRGTDRGPLFVAGFSWGARAAYTLAARGDEALSGLIILDGDPASIQPPAGAPAAMEIAGTTWDERERLLKAVIASPQNPSPLPGFRTAGSALADLLWNAPGFGGPGGLSAARDGVSNVQSLARLLDTYDRYWPRGTLGGSAPRPRGQLRVLAFAGENEGPAWVESVRAGAVAFGGEQATVRTLPMHGHLDVLVGRLSPEEVFEPTRRWIMGPAEPLQLQR